MKIAYVINQYPQTSQSFIRREIAALESRGAVIHRFTVRRWGQKLVDSNDAAERDQTRAVLEGGKLAMVLRLFTATLSAIVRSPGSFLRALRLTMQLGGRSNRGRLVHLLVEQQEYDVALAELDRADGSSAAGGSTGDSNDRV